MPADPGAVRLRHPALAVARVEGDQPVHHPRRDRTRRAVRPAGRHQHGLDHPAHPGQGHDPAVHLLRRLVGAGDGDLRRHAAVADPRTRRSPRGGVMVEPRPIVLATGGTGGHVFPAEALAGELEARGVPFALVTDSRGRQWQGALAHRPIHYIHSASPTGSLQRRLRALLSLALGLLDAWRALGRVAPAAVVGFGGYASVPTMIAARLRGTPAMVHEQNAVLGKANR